MSVHYKCDVCGREIETAENAVSNRIRRHIGRVHVEVHVGLVGDGRNVVAPTWNNGQVCHGCVEAVVANGTDT